MPPLDRIAIVDWSANSTPKLGSDSIWIGVLERDDGWTSCRLRNVPTRAEATDAIVALACPGERTFVGVDFSLGFPRGTAASLGLAGWEATWELLARAVCDDARNANNRFEVAGELNRRLSDGPGPFWGCPRSRATARLTVTKPDADPGWPPTWRHVEDTLRDGGSRPFSAWQLHGNGAVGSQSLVGIAALQRLRTRLGRRMAVWPFTTGLAVPPDDVDLVVAEVWPSMWPTPDGAIRDAAQVEATARRVAAAERAGSLHRWFAPVVDTERARDVVDEEGWILGVGV